MSFQETLFSETEFGAPLERRAEFRFWRTNTPWRFESSRPHYMRKILSVRASGLGIFCCL
ncbi:hypothetical protein D3C75_549190 [compost metagenome]